jgi:hypothetical protein
MEAAYAEPRRFIHIPAAQYFSKHTGDFELAFSEYLPP